MANTNNFFNFNETTESYGTKFPPHKKAAGCLAPLIVLGTFLFIIFNRPIYPVWPVLIPLGFAAILWFYACAVLPWDKLNYPDHPANRPPEEDNEEGL